MSESSLRIAPRSAVAIADIHLLHAARTDPAPVESRTASLFDRLRRTLARGMHRA